jgi:hypothetical protein
MKYEKIASKSMLGVHGRDVLSNETTDATRPSTSNVRVKFPTTKRITVSIDLLVHIATPWLCLFARGPRWATRRRAEGFGFHEECEGSRPLFGGLLDHLIRSRQHVWRNPQADLLGCLEIDDQLEFCRLLDGQIGWLGAL